MKSCALQLYTGGADGIVRQWNGNGGQVGSVEHIHFILRQWRRAGGTQCQL